MPAPDVFYKRREGKPPKLPGVTPEALMRELAANPATRENPILHLANMAHSYHRERHHAPVSACLEAIRFLAEYAHAAAQLDLFGDPLEECNCGHPLATHGQHGGYCIVCLYKINGHGYHGCKAFRSRADTGAAVDGLRWACNCGRVWADRENDDYEDKDYPRVHTRAPGKTCYERRPEGLRGRMLRFKLEPLPQVAP